MRIQLRELRRQQEQDLNFSVDVDLTKVHPNVEKSVKVFVKARARYSEDLYVIDGRLNAVLTLKCSKCLTAYDWPLESDWHEVFSREQPAQAEEKDDTNIHVVEEDEVDLLPYIREVLLLEIPFVPVCRDDCRGLCPVCGVNRNTDDCDCKQETIDPRLAELENFFSSKDNT